MSVYRAIVIGCGNIGALLEAEPRRPKPATHAGALLLQPKTKLVGLVDSNRKNLDKARRLFPKAELFSDVGQSLKEIRPNLVVVATPPQSHRKMIEMCVKAGVKNILCEKPIAHSITDARAIETLVKKYKLNFVLNYQRRFFALFKEAKDAIRAGAIGTVAQVSCYYSNGINNNGGHSIDALYYLLDDEIVLASGFFNKRNTTHPKGDYTIDGFLVTKKGVHITLQSVDQAKWGIHDLRMLGSKGMLELAEFGYALIETPVKPSVFSKVPQLDAKSAKQKRQQESMVAGALREVVAKKGGVQFARQGIKVLQVLEALGESAQKGGVPVKL